MAKAPVFVALDTTDLAQAEAWAAAVAPHLAGVKIGLEFFYAHGAAGAQRVAAHTPLFLDLKLHDIPNTVAGGLRAVLGHLQPRYINIHAGGGPAMIRAAADAVATASPATRLLAVTVLTSLDDADLAAVGQQGPAAEQVLRLARLARANGAHGVVCSPAEVAMLRAEIGPDFDLVVPGIRPAGAAVQDQKRVMTPPDAIAAGATALVIGRPITGAPDPAEAARQIAASLAA
ncbi:MAG: orotidine-5'-phosphate decarboxylase [Alphaproteobacteria bacterium]|nr:orotidine-5'-phosphate decarboxylase [Alphaproteobacteria bacterium]